MVRGRIASSTFGGREYSPKFPNNLIPIYTTKWASITGIQSIMRVRVKIFCASGFGAFTGLGIGLADRACEISDTF